MPEFETKEEVVALLDSLVEAVQNNAPKDALLVMVRTVGQLLLQRCGRAASLEVHLRTAAQERGRVLEENGRLNKLVNELGQRSGAREYLQADLERKQKMAERLAAAIAEVQKRLDG